MYNIIQLNDKNLSELQTIAQELGIKKTDSLKKEEIVYKILDEQAIAGATKKVAADKLKEEMCIRDRPTAYACSLHNSMRTKFPSKSYSAQKSKCPCWSVLLCKWRPERFWMWVPVAVAIALPCKKPEKRSMPSTFPRFPWR